MFVMYYLISIVDKHSQSFDHTESLESMNVHVILIQYVLTDIADRLNIEIFWEQIKSHKC